MHRLWEEKGLRELTKQSLNTQLRAIRTNGG